MWALEGAMLDYFLVTLCASLVCFEHLSVLMFHPGYLFLHIFPFLLCFSFYKGVFVCSLSEGQTGGRNRNNDLINTVLVRVVLL